MKLIKECFEYNPCSEAEVAEYICNHLPSEEDIHQKILNLNPSVDECYVTAAARKLQDAVKCYMDCVAEEYGLSRLESIDALDAVIQDIQAEGIDDLDLAAVLIVNPEVPPLLIEAMDSSSSFVELEGFRRDWKSLGLTDEDLRDLQNQIIHQTGKIDALGSGVYKIRFSPKSLTKGKDTADRVIYIEVIKVGKIYLATAFSESDEASISAEALEMLRTTAKALNRG